MNVAQLLRDSPSDDSQRRRQPVPVPLSTPSGGTQEQGGSWGSHDRTRVQSQKQSTWPMSQSPLNTTGPGIPPLPPPPPPYIHKPPPPAAPGSGPPCVQISPPVGTSPYPGPPPAVSSTPRRPQLQTPQPGHAHAPPSSHASPAMASLQNPTLTGSPWGPGAERDMNLSMRDREWDSSRDRRKPQPPGPGIPLAGPGTGAPPPVGPGVPGIPGKYFLTCRENHIFSSPV